MSDATADNRAFARCMGAVALELLGEPNKALSNRDELRWGTRGSLSVDLRKGTFCDHADGDAGGGVLDLLRRQRGLDKPAAIAWLRERKHLPDLDGGKPRIVATYDYTNAAGVLIFQVCRFEPKDFRQRRPDGTGGWIWKMTGVQKVLYHLPHVLAAVEARQTIFICEGEKSVEAMVRHGLVATCSPGGAGKWKDGYTAALACADVVVLPDNDEPGDKHAADVLRALKKTAWRVRVQALPNLPPKGDAHDYFAAGGTAASLLQFMADTAPRGWADIPHPTDAPAIGAARHDETQEAEPPRVNGADTVVSARNGFHQLRDLLDKDHNNAVRATHVNLMVILKDDPLLRGLVRRDAFTGRTLIMRAAPVISASIAPAPGPYPRQVDDGDATRVLAYLQKEWAHGFRRATVDECLATEAQDAQFHPIKDWLASLRWDGKPRLNQWLTRVFGCDLDLYHEAIASKILIAAVRRVRQPGCKFDYMLVLCGKQGIGKSRALALLFGPELFTDDLPDDLSNKDAAISLAGAWCVVRGTGRDFAVGSI